MTKKSSDSDLVTKDYLDQALDARFGDFNKQIDARFGDFNKQVDARFGDFRAELNGKFTEFEYRIQRGVDEAISKAMDKLYTRIDPLLSEIENNRIDSEMTTDKLEDHERRLQKLEHS